MTTFDQAHHGDKVRICLPGGTTKPLRLLVDPAPCSDSCCLALHSRGVDRMGWVEPIRAYADTVIDVIELGPSSSAPELATPSGDVLAAADDEDAMSAHLSAEQPAPSYRGGPPRRPGDAMTPGYEDALGAYLDPKEPPLPATPTPIADPVERLERLDEWADDLNDTDDAGDDEK